MYSPTQGRFISIDPIGFQAGDANLYRFVGNTPTNATDPSGLCDEKPVAPAPRPVPSPVFIAPRPRPQGVPLLKFVDGQVFAGHGEWFPEDGYTVIPTGTSLTFFTPADSYLGNVAEEDKLLKEPPKFWLDRPRPSDLPPTETWYNFRPSGRLVDVRSPLALSSNPKGDDASYWTETYYAGESVPNYTLFPASGGKFGVKRPDGQPYFIEFDKIAVAGNKATTFEKPMKLSALLKPNQGNVWWSACRVHCSAVPVPKK